MSNRESPTGLNRRMQESGFNVPEEWLEIESLANFGRETELLAIRTADIARAIVDVSVSMKDFEGGGEEARGSSVFVKGRSATTSSKSAVRTVRPVNVFLMLSMMLLEKEDWQKDINLVLGFDSTDGTLSMVNSCCFRVS